MSAQDHGSASTYQNWGCRCAECRAAHTAKCAEQRAARWKRTKRGPIPAEHGRYTTYGNWNCRCRACTDAWADYERTKRAAQRGVTR